MGSRKQISRYVFPWTAGRLGAKPLIIAITNIEIHKLGHEHAPSRRGRGGLDVRLTLAAFADVIDQAAKENPPETR
jgi:hypothetical protein